MLTQAEYTAMLARAEVLCVLDPDADSDAGKELLAIVEQLQEYEHAHFPFKITKLDIVELRGGMPENCDFCCKPTPAEQLEPEEAGDWVCWECLKKWAVEDDNLIEAHFWEQRLKEVACAH